MAQISYRPNDEIGIRGINSADLLQGMETFVKNGYHYLPLSHYRQSPISPLQSITMTKDPEKRVQISESATVSGDESSTTVSSYNAEDFLGICEKLFEREFLLKDAPVMFHGRYSATFSKVHHDTGVLHNPEDNASTLPELPAEEVTSPEDTPVLADDVVTDTEAEESFNLNHALSLTTKDELAEYAGKFGFKLDKRGALESMQEKLKVMVR